MSRFLRTEMLFGREAMERLSLAHVAVAGLGAVGSYAVEGLVRAGVGNIRLIDFDVVRPSNINRQLYALESTIGRSKVELARERVMEINPHCNAEALRIFVDKNTAGQVLRPPLDAVIDAIDSLGPKTDLLAAAVNAGVPVVSSMGAASRTDPGAVRVADIAETELCPLARRVRKLLRKKGIDRGIRCVFSVEPAKSSTVSARELAAGESEHFERGRTRRPIGSFSCLTGIFGLVAAREVIMAIVKPMSR